MFALSVSISTISCPFVTSSPSETSHFRIVPSSIESDRRGMVTSVAISGSSYRSRKVARAACTTCSGWGKDACSSGFEYGIGTSAPVTRPTGASR